MRHLHEIYGVDDCPGFQQRKGTMRVIYLAIALTTVVIFASVAVAQSGQPSIEAIERRAFLAGAAASWHPVGDRWTFDKIDRSDPDWEAVFKAWLQGGRQ